MSQTKSTPKEMKHLNFISITFRQNEAHFLLSVMSMSPLQPPLPPVIMLRESNESTSKMKSRLELTLQKKWKIGPPIVKSSKASYKKQKVPLKPTTEESAPPPPPQPASSPALSSSLPLIVLKIASTNEDVPSSLLDELTHKQFWPSYTSSSLIMSILLHDNEYTDFEVLLNPPIMNETSCFFNQGCMDIYATLPSLNPIISSQNADSVLLEWRRSNVHASNAKPADFFVVSTESSYIPAVEDVGKYLSVVLTPVFHSLHGIPLVLNCSETPVLLLPNSPVFEMRREWVNAKPSHHTDHNTGLRLLTYNLLADLYTSQPRAQTSIFRHVHKKHLAMSRRFPLLLSEILFYSADVVLLQEVDEKVYSTLLEPSLNSCGLKGVYTNKDSRQREGLAVFWRIDRFGNEPVYQFESAIRHLFSDLDGWESVPHIRSFVTSQRHLEKVMMEKVGTVMQLIILKFGDHKIVVCNTHLFFHPLADHIRVMQVFAVCKKASELALTFGAQGLLLGGDLNSDPASGAAQLLLTKRLTQSDASYEDCWKNLFRMTWGDGDEDENDIVEASATSFAAADSNVASSYGGAASVQIPSLVLPTTFPPLFSATGCPDFSNYANGFVETLDYIFASEHFFEGESIAPIPTRDEIKTKYVAMPNCDWMSDHVALVCDVKIRGSEREAEK